MTYLAIALGAALGAVLRHAVNSVTAERWGTAFPYGTLLINVSGSLLIGFLFGALAERFIDHPLWRLFLATGFLGGYTTFSTYTLEALSLLRDGAYGSAVLYVAGSVFLGLVAIAAGMAAGQWAHHLTQR